MLCDGESESQEWPPAAGDLWEMVSVPVVLVVVLSSEVEEEEEEGGAGGWNLRVYISGDLKVPTSRVKPSSVRCTWLPLILPLPDVSARPLVLFMIVGER